MSLANIGMCAGFCFVLFVGSVVGFVQMIKRSPIEVEDEE